MTDGKLDELLAGISVYQDVVVHGQVARRGERDCEARWSLIEPHLPQSGVLCDVGSNFGWFGLRATSTRPDMVVLSAEADERSARVQQAILSANRASRIMLVTRRAGADMLQQLARAGQQLDVVLCLSILHWMPDHRPFVQALAGRAQRIFFEYPDPRETGVGSQRIRDEIGDFADYLRANFPHHTIRCLGNTPGLASNDHARAIWMVETTDALYASSSSRLDVDALLPFTPAWPLRPWWRSELARLRAAAHGTSQEMDRTNSDPAPRLCFTPNGVAIDRGTPASKVLARFERQLSHLPEAGLFTSSELLRRRSRGLGSAVAGRLNSLGRRLSFSR